MIPEEQKRALDSWQTSARYWDKYRVVIAQIFAPLTSGLEMSGTLREKMARLAPEKLPTVKQAVADAARKYFASGTMSFPAEALIVSGRKLAV